MQLEIIKNKLNGYKMVKISQTKLFKELGVHKFRAFSIFSNGSLEKCHSLELGFKTISNKNCDLWLEVKTYLKEYGTNKQKSIMGVK
jgi:hypothetical protein